MKIIIIVVLSLSIIFGFLWWRFGPKLGSSAPPSESVQLTFWGFDEENVIKPLIAQYQKDYPSITITYIKQSAINYRTRVQTKIREGQGPDIFPIHNSWVGMFEGELAEAPTGTFALGEYQRVFIPLAAESFVKEGRIYSVPLEVDGLALYINEDILTSVGLNSPKSWQEFIEAANKVTVKDAAGQIKTAGAALGATANIDFWSDILGLLLLQQPNVNLTSPAQAPVAEVFRFYTGFITDPKKKSWDVNLPLSTQMFAAGNLAFYFAPYKKVAEIKSLNPNLKFKIVPVPQLPGRQVAWGSFWGVAVSERSSHIKESWEFIKFLTSAPSQKLLNSTASSLGLPLKPYSRVDLAPEVSADPYLGAYVTQGPYYKSWYLHANTQDNGINDEMVKLWEGALNATLQGTDPQVALQSINSGIKGVLDKYIKSQ